MTKPKKVAIVTGGMSGIGLAVVKLLLAEGVQVCAGGRRASDPEAARQFHLDTGDVANLQALDVTSTESVESFVTHVKEALGTPVILINAAGLFLPSEIIGHTDDLWSDMIETNLTGCFRTIRSTLPGMKEAGWGRIVNIASTAAHIGAEGYSAYCASKAGLLGLSRCTSLEGAPHGVTCTTISPTWVETDMMQRSLNRAEQRTGRSRADILAEYETSNPQGKLVQPEEVAKLAAFLASDDARAITMEDIQINAGSIW